MNATIVQAGALNTTAIVNPGLYVQINTPAAAALNGTPTDVVGLVGTATWGPVNQPTICSAPADYATTFGSVQNRKYDMGTALAVASQQGANNFRCVRVTDGTDTAATAALGTSWLTLTAKYTGSFGNNIVATWGFGARANTSRLTIQVPGQPAEVFDNLVGSGNALALAAAAAVNNGNGVLRGPSNFVIAAASTGTVAPTTGTAVTLSNRTDGATTITGSVLVGQDTTPRKGMYALRRQGVSIATLCDCDDTTQWTTITAFCVSEGIYGIQNGPSGDTITNAVSTKASAGIDTTALKVMFGDWIYWQDTTNGVTRLVSPSNLVVGLLANLDPSGSTLNKPLQAVVGSQKAGIPGTAQANTYSSAEIQTLLLAGIDVIANPSPGGAYFSVRGGINSSSNNAVNGDNYTRMTNYCASTFAAGIGLFVGEVMSNAWFDSVKSILLGTLANMLGQGQLVQYAGGPLPYSVQCDSPAIANTNNPQTRVSLGYGQADVIVRYGPINTKFIVNLTGGQTANPTVSVTATSV